MNQTVHYTCIHELVKEFPANAILAEIGCYEGEATMIFAKVCKTVCAIDPWVSGYDDTDIVSNADLEYIYNKVFLPNMSKFDNVDIIRKTSVAAAAKVLTSSLDVVYIDAKHTYTGVQEDIAIWTPKIRKGGLLCGHDYSKEWPGVVRAVEEAIGKPDKIYDDTSWIYRIKE